MKPIVSVGNSIGEFNLRPVRRAARLCFVRRQVLQTTGGLFVRTADGIRCLW